ncbi:acyl carrier protein [Amycolatopsis pigmentata]|uniref:Acyl carrier protein n=1 Tax=Amycolatopsis pigmentata TaxID=450801 RepID=A0ABW5FJ08_9PSEU
MTRDEICQMVRDVLTQQLRLAPEEIRPDGILHELPGADSIRLLQVITQLEQNLGLEFSDKEIFEPHTFEGLVTIAWTRVGRK